MVDSVNMSNHWAESYAIYFSSKRSDGEQQLIDGEELWETVVITAILWVPLGFR